MVHANRFLQTKSYDAMRAGRLALSEFATDPRRSIFKRLMTVFDPQVTGQHQHRGHPDRARDRHYAMTEGLISVQFDPKTLETLGMSVIRARLPPRILTATPTPVR